MLLYGFSDRHEDDALLLEFILVSGLYRDRIHDGIHGSTAESESLFERNTEFVERLFEFRVNLFIDWFLRQRVCIIRNSLIINRRHIDMCPCRLLKSQPMTECFETKLQHPVGLSLLGRDESYHLFGKSYRYYFRMYVSSEAVFIFLLSHLLDIFILF